LLVTLNIDIVFSTWPTLSQTGATNATISQTID